jgi:predicted ArsR family transcriptional regulator
VEPPIPQDLQRRLGQLALLAEPTRRSLYLYVTSQPHDVGRDEAAAAAGVSRAQAAFHLDRLVEGGLLEATYRRLSGRRGPGAGRPDKLYRRSSREHDVSLPPRDYKLAADLLARAMEEPRSRASRSSLGEVAGRFGQTLGAEIRSRLGRRASRERALGAVAEALGGRGYQPYRQGAELRLGNCPFRALADAHRDLVCGMNLSLMTGVVGGMDATDLEARRDVVPGQCCVTIGPRQERQ